MPKFSPILAFALLLAVPQSAGADLPEPDARHRIEEISVSADASTGYVRTTPMHMRGTRGQHHWGGKACRTYRLNRDVLSELQRAMREKVGILVESDTVKARDGTTTSCLKRVSFFAPDP